MREPTPPWLLASPGGVFCCGQVKKRLLLHAGHETNKIEAAAGGEFMVGIREIRIENFRAIERLDLSFLNPRGEPNRIVVLGGPNGCGKTSVLEACLLAGGFHRTFTGPIQHDAIRAGAADYRIRVELDNGNEVRSKDFGSQDYLGGELPCAYFPSSRSQAWVGPIGIAQGNPDNGQREDSAHLLRRIKQRLVNARAYEAFPQWNNPDAGFQQTIAIIDQAWNHFYPDENFVVEPISNRPDDGFDVFRKDRSGIRIAVDLLSSGQLELFCFIGGLLFERFDEGLIVIDEPELHLDPQWHRPLLQALRTLKPKCQLIVGTHSPEVYHSVRSYERHFLVPESDPRAQAWTEKVPAEVEAD